MTCRQPIDARFMEKVQLSAECWTWLAGKNNRGHGRFYTGPGHKKVLAHRFSYELHREPIPAGLEIDHLCRNHACVNPAHLEPVTRRVNQRRGFSVSGNNARKTHCARGHAFDAENTATKRDGSRACKTCHREDVMASKTHCDRGHEYSAENTIVTRTGQRKCRSCRAASVASRTHCRRGHEYTPANTLMEGTARKCRACRNLGVRNRRNAACRG